MQKEQIKWSNEITLLDSTIITYHNKNIPIIKSFWFEVEAYLLLLLKRQEHNPALDYHLFQGCLVLGVGRIVEEMLPPGSHTQDYDLVSKGTAWYSELSETLWRVSIMQPSLRKAGLKYTKVGLGLQEKPWQCCKSTIIPKVIITQNPKLAHNRPPSDLVQEKVPIYKAQGV